MKKKPVEKETRFEGPDKGVLIIAAGHPYYGQLALNLCLSIKYSCPSMPVALATYGEGATRIQNHIYMFDTVVPLGEEMVTSHGIKSYLKAKTYAYDISPYRHTALLDADTIWHPRRGVNELLDSLKDVEFTIGNRSKMPLSTASEDHLQWTNPKQIQDATNFTGDVYNLSSEFIYFKKSVLAKSLFDAAKLFFDEPGVNYKRFAGGVPDELAFQLAMISLNIEPHQCPFLPFYWEHQHKKMLKPKELYDNWWGYSMGGKFNSDHARTIYDNLARWYYNHWGLKFQSPIRNKSDLMPERKHI